MPIEMIYECRKCFGRVLPQGDGSYGICESCGTRVDYPKDNIVLLNRANKMRARREFDQARFLYTNVTRTHPEVAEGWWGKLLCEYGVEYVEEHGKRTPTINRINYNAVFDSEDYKQAIAHATQETAAEYAADAALIQEIQQRLLALSKKEEPYDVFISFKDREDTPERSRTDDSVLAQRIFDALTDAGYKVFFSRITLRHAVGQDFEPKIFAALQSAPLMIVVGCSAEHVMAPWVRNEWSRYLRLMRTNPDKHLLSVVQGMKLEQLPGELAKLEGIVAQGLSYMQDILKAVDGCVHSHKEHRVKEEQERLTGGYIKEEKEKLLQEGYHFLDVWDAPKANRRFQDALELDPQLARAWWGLYLLETKNQDPAIDPKDNKNAMHAYELAIAYAADEELKQFEQEETGGIIARKRYLKRQELTRFIIGLGRRASTFEEEEAQIRKKTDSYTCVPTQEQEWEELSEWCGLLQESFWGEGLEEFKQNTQKISEIHDGVSGYLREMEELEKENQTASDNLNHMRNHAASLAKQRDRYQVRPLNKKIIIAAYVCASFAFSMHADGWIGVVFVVVALVCYVLTLRRFLVNRRGVKKAFLVQKQVEKQCDEYASVSSKEEQRIRTKVEAINKTYQIAFPSVPYKGAQQAVNEFASGLK